MVRLDVRLTRKQCEEALPWPEEAKLTDRQVKRIVEKALETIQNGKATTEEVMDILSLPPVVRVTRKVSASILEELRRQIIKNGPPTIKLHKSQLFDLVNRLPVQDKVKLKNRLEADLAPWQREIDAAFDKSLRKVRRAYQDISEEQIGKDVAEAISEVREQRAKGSR